MLAEPGQPLRFSDAPARRASRCETTAPVALLAIAVLLGAAIGGCASPPQATTVEVAPGEYERAFDAAVGVLRDAGFVTAVRDRSGGVIETEPMRIGGILEPWQSIGQPWSVSAESTLALQRRRARIEFVRDDRRAMPPDPADPLMGSDVVGASSPDLRLASQLADGIADGGVDPTRLRVWVAIERAHTPGLRRFAWTRSLTTRFIDPVEPIDPADGVVATSVWTPIGRDEDAERRIAERLRKVLQSDS